MSERSYRGAVALIAAVGAVAACSGSDSDSGTNPNPPGGTTVSASAASTFSPSLVEVEPGTVVTWIFGALAHNVIFAQTAGAPENIDVTVNRNVTRVFTTPGTFNYTCTLHSNMNGTVRVTAPPLNTGY